MKCTRAACKSENAVCRHTQSGKLYCPACAHAINEVNPGLVAFPDEATKQKMRSERVRERLRKFYH